MGRWEHDARTVSTADKGWAGIIMLIIMAVVTGIVVMCA